MLRVENTVTPSKEQWQAVIRGMRNPMNSWEKSDSYVEEYSHDEIDEFILGKSDRKLMTSLREEGSPCRKFLRMIPVYVDIVAPIYWWKEFDTYKIGTVANSCSTMHKIHSRDFNQDDFSSEHLLYPDDVKWGNYAPQSLLGSIIKALNENRRLFVETKDKRYWWQMIQLLPASYNQRRTIFLNYEVLLEIYKWRHNHKLDEWHTFCDWIKSLPYANELIIGKEVDDG